MHLMMMQNVLLLTMFKNLDFFKNLFFIKKYINWCLLILAFSLNASHVPSVIKREILLMIEIYTEDFIQRLPWWSSG